MQAMRRRWQPLTLAALATLLIAGLAGAMSASGNGSDKEIKFAMVRSAAATNAGCLAGASAKVKVENEGAVEELELKAKGLPPRTNFDFFVIQVPNAPFGLSWYQGDFETDRHGRGEQEYKGRFNVETFIVAPGTAPAPKVHDADATTNPATPPVHTFHLGLWFNSPQDAARAGCPATVTPFNGDHTAGIQVLSTRNFGDDQGPLRQLVP
jgi:hypothetical protein